MTRSCSNKLYAFNSKIDRTLHSFTSNPTNNSDFSEFSSVDTNSNSNIADNTSHGPNKMKNNDRTLKKLATLDVILAGIPRDVFHHEAAWNTRGLYQNESIPIFPRWSHQGLAILTTGSVQHLGGYEVNVFGEFLSSIQNSDHSEGDL
ncbi:hypothetical protein CR513_38777, partial [Mucuna pruriens]